jgi:hypothetical protein
MKYLLAIYVDESSWEGLSPDDMRRTTEEYGAFTQQVTEAGAILGGDALQPVATATTVRVRDGERIVSDGPFAETKEQLGGFYLLDCANLDEAIGWAEKIPGARTGSIEIRPVMVYDESESNQHPATAADRA